MDITPYLGTIVTIVISVCACYAAISSRLTRLETLIETLSANAEKHVDIAERTHILETQMQNVYHQLDELKKEVHSK